MDAEGEHSSGRCRVELALFLNELSLCASLTSSCPTSTVRSLLDCRSSEVTEVAGLAAELGKRRARVFGRKEGIEADLVFSPSPPPFASSQEAQKFMRHSRRSTMLPCDINHALQALNIEVSSFIHLLRLPPFLPLIASSCSDANPASPRPLSSLLSPSKYLLLVGFSTLAFHPLSQPLYGHLPLPSSSGHPTFVPLRATDTTATRATALTSASGSTRTNVYLAPSSIDQFYYLQDQEISFDQLLKTKPPGLVGGGVRWTAHWLAVEGVMPRVPENVAMDYHKAHLKAKEGGAGASGGGEKGGAAAAVGGAVGGVGAGPKLSQELQLYFTRLTKALLPGGGGEVAVAAAGKDGELTSVERARLAALASLRGDTGLQGLVVYLVRWIGEKVRLDLFLSSVLARDGLFLHPR